MLYMIDPIINEIPGQELQRKRIVYPGVGIYYGYTKNGAPHGKGVMRYDIDGDKPCEIYIGDWKQAKRHGKGTFTKHNDTYVGDWVNDEKHGKGNSLNINGEYIGQWKNGNFDGHGTKIENSGTKYVGQFVNNKEVGMGTKYMIDGSKYTGNWSRMDMNGEGSIEYANRDKYVGYLWKSFYQGDGTWYDSNNKKVYICKWIMGDMSPYTKIKIRSMQPSRMDKVGFLEDVFLKDLSNRNKDKTYHLPQTSIYKGSTKRALSNFIKPSTIKKKIDKLIEGSIRNPSLYKNKPCSFFLINAHGGYETQPYGDKGTFYVPDGIRLVFMNKSTLYTDNASMELFSDPDFMKPICIQRDSYRTVTPAYLFSQFISNRNGRSWETKDICDFMRNKVLPNKITQKFDKWSIVENLGRDKKDMLLHTCHASIYDSNMECKNMILDFDPKVGSGSLMKVGVYPLPNVQLEYTPPDVERLNSGWDLENAFKGGFMPLGERQRYETDPRENWYNYGNSDVPLDLLVEGLPRGSIEHPCVYFVSACRVVMDKDKYTALLLRQHSDEVHAPVLRRNITTESELF